MNKHLIRLIALILVPCLIADPLCAAGMSLHADSPIRNAASLIPFSVQALSAPYTTSPNRLHFRHFAVIGALALATLGLANCGGGGGTPTAPSSATPAPAAPTGQVPVSTVLLEDGFSGPGLDTSKWSIPTGPSSFLGITQIRPPTSPMQVSNGSVHLQLDSNNPSALKPGDSFFGSGLYSNQTFAPTANTAISFTATAALQQPVPSGAVASVFLYGLNRDGVSRNEIDFELLTKGQQVMTNLFTEEGFSSAGNWQYVPGNLAQTNEFKILWFTNKIQFFINGTMVREVTSNIPTKAMSAYFNLWVPKSDFQQAYDPALQPASRAQDNKTWFYLVGPVKVESIATPAATPSRLAAVGRTAANALSGTADIFALSLIGIFAGLLRRGEKDKEKERKPTIEELKLWGEQNRIVEIDWDSSDGWLIHHYRGTLKTSHYKIRLEEPSPRKQFLGLAGFLDLGAGAQDIRYGQIRSARLIMEPAEPSRTKSGSGEAVKSIALLLAGSALTAAVYRLIEVPLYAVPFRVVDQPNQVGPSIEDIFILILPLLGGYLLLKMLRGILSPRSAQTRAFNNDPRLFLKMLSQSMETEVQRAEAAYQESKSEAARIDLERARGSLKLLRTMTAGQPGKQGQILPVIAALVAGGATLGAWVYRMLEVPLAAAGLESSTQLGDTWPKMVMALVVVGLALVVVHFFLRISARMNANRQSKHSDESRQQTVLSFPVKPLQQNSPAQDHSRDLGGKSFQWGVFAGICGAGLTAIGAVSFWAAGTIVAAETFMLGIFLIGAAGYWYIFVDSRTSAPFVSEDIWSGPGWDARPIGFAPPQPKTIDLASALDPVHSRIKQLEALWLSTREPQRRDKLDGYIEQLKHVQNNPPSWERERLMRLTHRVIQEIKRDRGESPVGAIVGLAGGATLGALVYRMLEMPLAAAGLQEAPISPTVSALKVGTALSLWAAFAIFEFIYRHEFRRLPAEPRNDALKILSILNREQRQAALEKPENIELLFRGSMREPILQSEHASFRRTGLLSGQLIKNLAKPQKVKEISSRALRADLLLAEITQMVLNLLYPAVAFALVYAFDVHLGQWVRQGTGLWGSVIKGLAYLNMILWAHASFGLFGGVMSRFSKDPHKRTFTSTGIFFFTRNPLYLANRLGTAALFIDALFTGRLSFGIVAVTVWIWYITQQLAKWEELKHTIMDGEPFVQYLRRTPRWVGIPKLKSVLSIVLPFALFSSGPSLKSRHTLAYSA
jgi:protein-S-isoprenylcysteine O-methyltransferase Ste14/GAF domain-containing protein